MAPPCSPGARSAPARTARPPGYVALGLAVTATVGVGVGVGGAVVADGVADGVIVIGVGDVVGNTDDGVGEGDT